MFLSRYLRDTRVTLLHAYREQGWMGLWETFFLPVGLPLLLALGMSVLLAVFIVGQNWSLVFGLLLLVPAAILFLTYPFAALLVWLALMPFLQTTATATFRTVYWFIHRAMPVGVLGILVLSNMLGLNRRRRTARLGLAELAMALFLGVGLVSILHFQSNPLPHLYLFYDRMFVPMCLYLLIRLAAPDRKDLERLLPIALFIILVESGVAVLSQVAPQVLPAEWLRMQAERGSGTFNNQYAYSMSLVFFCFLLFHAARQRRPSLTRSTYLLGIGVGVLGIFLAFSRGTWIGAVIASLGLLFLYPKTTIRVVAVLLIIMVILGSSVLSEQVDWAVQRLGEEESARDRWVIWDAGLQLIKAKPLFGWGYGDYTIHAGQLQRRVLNYVAANTHASHNAFLTISAELGLPSLLLFLFPVLWWLWLSFKAWQRMPRAGFWSRALLAILWLSLLNQAIVAMFTDTRYSIYAQGLWWITLALIGNLVELSLRPDDEKPPEWIPHAARTRGAAR